MTDLTASQWREIEAACGWTADGKPYVLLGQLRTIIKRSRRTLGQNSLLWALYSDAKLIGGELLGGWDTETIHEYMLGEYFGWVTTEALGRKRQTPVKRSSRLTKMEFSDFVEFVVRRFAEHNIVLELPGDSLAGTP
jgi:hypothetical protein